MSAAKPPAVNRRRGRPVDADPQVQRQRLLEVAGDVFAEQGPEAARVQEIATRAGVDRRLIYHYFESKDKLYVEVLAEHYARLREISGQLVVDAASVEQFMELLMRRFFAFCRANPQFARILAWENLRGAQGLAQMESLGMDKAILAKLQPLIRQEVVQGRCRSDLDARRLLVSGLGLCLYVLINQASLALVVGFRPTTARDWDRWLDHAVRQVVQGIRP